MKKISSEFDRMAVEVMRSIVVGQTMRLECAEGQIWTSSCKDVDGIAVITIKRKSAFKEEVVAKILYDYETSEEVEFIY